MDRRLQIEKAREKVAISLDRLDELLDDDGHGEDCVLRCFLIDDEGHDHSCDVCGDDE